MAFTTPTMLIQFSSAVRTAVQFLGRSKNLRILAAEAGPCSERMAAFGQQTDEEFSGLARGLGTLNQQFGTMRSEVGQLDHILQDRDQTHALGLARALCKNSIELVHASLGIAHSVQEQMRRVDDALLHTCKMRDEFDKSFLMLRTLAMGFRVEAARVDSEFQGVFANVAAAITDIDRRIAASTQVAFSRVEVLVSEAAEERERVRKAEAVSFSGANAAIDEVRTELDELGRALAPCAAASSEIDRLLGCTGELVMNVLRGLQYQDIVRQRLEHVGEGFDDISSAVTNNDGATRRDLAFAGKAANIQLRQLRSARVEIERGGREVVEGLEGLLGLGSEVLSRMDALERIASHVLSGNKVAEMFAREISALARIAEASETASVRVSGLVERIGSVVTVFSEEVAKQENEVRLVALNAQVAAARLVNAGALEKLAEETTRISHRNGQVSRDLASGLRDTLGRLTQIKAETTEFLGVVSTEKSVIERGAVDISSALKQHAETIQRMACGIRRDFAKVTAGVRGVLDGVNFPAEIQCCFDPAEELCRRIASAAGVVEDLVDGDARIAAHAARYTMEREREAHAAAAPGKPVTSAAAAGSPALASAGSAGDDIELF